MGEKKQLNNEDFSDLIDQIESLKKIEPQENWVIFCRANLAMRMKLEHKKEFLSNDISVLRGIFSFLKMNKRIGIFPKLAYATAFAMVLLAVGGSLTVWAAQNSLPGSPLYKVKLAVEGIRVKVASQAGKDRLQSEMATRRLEELKTVLDSSGTAQDKNDQVTEVVGQLQQQLISDKNQLPSADNNSQGKSLTMVKEVADRAKQVKKAIAEAKDSLPANIKADLSDKLAEVTDTADKTSLQALEAMIDKPGRTENDNNEIISGFKEMISENETAIGSLTDNKITEATSTADRFPINAVLVNQSDQAKDLIDKANQSLKNSDFLTALDTLKALNEIVKGAERIAENSDSVNMESIHPEKSLKNATSTNSSATSTKPSLDVQK